MGSGLVTWNTCFSSAPGPVLPTGVTLASGALLTALLPAAVVIEIANGVLYPGSSNEG